MEYNFEDAFYEVSEVIKTFPKEIIDKIPASFIQAINQNKSKTYYKEIKGLDNLENLKKETIAILGLIYRDFICDKKTRKVLLEEEQNERNDTFNYNDLFKKEDIGSIKKEATDLIAIKEDNWVKKIFEFFKSLF